MAESSFIQYGHFTHKGTVRSENQDAVLCAPHQGLWLVADGMGGHAQGEFASQAITRALAQTAQQLPNATNPVELLYDGINQANQTILQHAQSLGPNQIVGSTIVLLFLHQDNYHVLWAGDSRCYLLRDGHLSALTQDHTDPQSENILTNAVGVNAELVVDYHHGILYEDDMFLLCSDGLYKVYSDEVLATTLLQPEHPTKHCEALLTQALQQGASDNISTIIVKVGAAAAL